MKVKVQGLPGTKVTRFKEPRQILKCGP